MVDQPKQNKYYCLLLLSYLHMHDSVVLLLHAFILFFFIPSVVNFLGIIFFVTSYFFTVPL